MATADLRPVKYLVPANVGEAVDMKRAGARVLAGGTDLFPAHVGRPLVGTVVDIAGLTELRGISIVEGAVRIGALTRWAESRAPRCPRGSTGSVPRRARSGRSRCRTPARSGGNLCNASPAADGDPAAVEPRRLGRADVDRRAAACCRSSASSPGTGRRRCARRAADRGADPTGHA